MNTAKPETSQSLNKRFGASSQISFTEGPGGLVVADLVSPSGKARVALLGGHVLEFQPAAEDPVLFTSQESYYAVGKEIRGGIPVCFPWFGRHEEHPEAPGHGFVRTALWEVRSTRILSGGIPQIILGISDQQATSPIFPYPYDAEITVEVSDSLRTMLSVRNPGKQPFQVTCALHTYFAISDIRQVSISGLEGVDYLDKVENFKRKTQAGKVTFSSETDRVYLDTTSTCSIHDPGLHRYIHVAKNGSHTTVVWNPWIEKAIRMPDFGNDEYLRMVCVETANAANDVVVIAPGEAHHLTAEIWVERSQD